MSDELGKKLDGIAASQKEINKKITSVEESAQSQLAEAQRLAKEAAGDGSFNKESAKAMILDAMSKIDKEKEEKGTLFGTRFEDKCNLPDTWRSGWASAQLGNPDPAELLQKGAKNFMTAGDRKFSGMDALLYIDATDENHKRFQQISDDTRLAYSLAIATKSTTGQADFAERFPRITKTYLHALTEYRRFMGIQTKADETMDSGTGISGGADWIPTGFSSQLTELIKIRLVVAGLFQRFNMPTNPFALPVNLTDTTGRFITEAGPDFVNPTDDNITNILDMTQTLFTAGKLRARMVTSGELVEDSIIAMLPLINRQLASILANSVEDCLINGQTDASMDTDVASTLTLGTGDPRLTFNGLRWWANEGDGTDPYESDFGGVAPTTAGQWTDLRKEMGEFGVDPGSLAYIVTINTYLQMIEIPEVLTLEKYGSNATILTGELAQLLGIPVIVSRYQREDTDVTGVNGASANDFSTCVIVNRDAFLIGDRRSVTIESEKWINTDQWNLVAMQRLDFEGTQGAVGTTSARKVCVRGINILN